MKVAAIQTDIAWQDPAANFAACRPLLHAAAADGARLLVLPEMFACGFSMDTNTVAEPPDGPSATFLRAEARALGAWLAGSVPIRRPGAPLPHNTLVLAGPAGELHTYAKVHPFTYQGEHEHYAAGTELVTVGVEGLRLSLFVCYDLRFADEFWQLAGETDCYVVVANWPAARREHWRVLLEARAIENQAYVIGVNRVGRGGASAELAYSGDSVILDPRGEALAEAGDGVTSLVADVDAAVVREVRRSFPVLQDRRSSPVGFHPA